MKFLAPCGDNAPDFVTCGYDLGEMDGAEERLRAGRIGMERNVEAP
ncbi:MAG: hypothetical protein WKF44_01975 [Rubrobacteraceae bacterium]